MYTSQNLYVKVPCHVLSEVPLHINFGVMIPSDRLGVVIDSVYNHVKQMVVSS